MTTSRRTLLTLVPALLLALLWPTPTQAADEIGLSRDGVTWTPELDMPLFESSMLWVPGDDETRTVQVRNQGPSAASMTIEALSPAGDPLLMADVALSVRVDGAAWLPVGIGTAEQAVTVRPLQAGQAVPVDVRAVFDPASTNPTQELDLPVTLRITLVDALAGAGDGDGDGGTESEDRAGGLPGTGAVVAPELVLAALALCAFGALLIARRSSDDDPRNGVTP